MQNDFLKSYKDIHLRRLLTDSIKVSLSLCFSFLAKVYGLHSMFVHLLVVLMRAQLTAKSLFLNHGMAETLWTPLLSNYSLFKLRKVR